jgi:hypothetical protein
MSDFVYRDRLSSAADKWLFFGLWLAGTAGIILCKVFEKSPWGMGVGILVLLIYALAVWRSPRYRVREDRAGDSAYYLGFLFTLTSLAYALWEFATKGHTTEVIIGNFAIALATTIVGLALRVLFQQFREEPIEIEQQVRLEIADRVSQLRSQLLQVVEDMSSLSAAVRGELKDGFAESLTHITDAAVKRMQTASDEHVALSKSSLASFVSTVDEIKTQAIAGKAANKRFVESVERLTTKIERAEVPTERINQAIQALTKVIAEAGAVEQERLKEDQTVRNNLREMAESARRSIELVCEGVPKLRDSVQQSAKEVGAFGAAVTAANREIVQQAEVLVVSAEKQRATWGALVKNVDESVAVVRHLQGDLAAAVKESGHAVIETQKSLVSLAHTVVGELGVR